MDAKTKVAVNTLILYAKILISMLLSLVTVPIILRALGENDYGVYNLVAGVISMLAFLNASMSIASQRYLSVSKGEGHLEKLNKIFNVSIVMHFIVAGAVLIILEICFPFLFSGFLNIEPDRINAAKLVYQFLVVSTFFSIISVPMEAALNAEENMLSFSIINILSSVLKFCLALFLVKCPGDRLIIYGAGMLMITVITYIIYLTYVLLHYRGKYTLNLRLFDGTVMKGMFGFMGWNALGSFAMLGRNQGVAIIFNVFFGTVANAAYGIANQVHGALQYFSSTFQKAINPQLMISEGMNSRDRLIRIAFISSRVSVFVLSLFAVPLILEMPYVLKIWLHDVPDYTIGLCQLMLISSIIYQYSAGLMSSVQAVGKIKGYMIAMSVLILMTIPISYVLLKVGLPIYTVMIVWASIEAVSLAVRLYQASTIVGISVPQFLKKVLLPTLIAILVSASVALFVQRFMTQGFVRLVVVTLVFVAIYVVISWFKVFDSSEHAMVSNFLGKFRRKISK